MHPERDGTKSPGNPMGSTLKLKDWIASEHPLNGSGIGRALSEGNSGLALSSAGCRRWLCTTSLHKDEER